MIKKIILSIIVIGLCLFPVIINAGEKEEAECAVEVLQQQKIIIELRAQLLQVAHDQTTAAEKIAKAKVKSLITKVVEEE